MTASLLSNAERARVYLAQVGLQAVKICASCQRPRPVDQFGGYGAPRCFSCAPTTRGDVFDKCSCGTQKLSHLLRCHDCQLKRTGERRSTAVVV
jgi:hypothetical protein